MKFRLYVLTAFMLVCPALAHAQDFGVMESAETINRGNWKLKANPMLILLDGDTKPGVGLAAGYGFTDTFDFEAKLALYDGITFIGGDVEFWLVKDPNPFDLSVAAGFHFANTDFIDETGVDVTIIGSHAVTPKLDIYAAIDMAFNKLKDVSDSNYTTLHLVPGIEYKLHQDLDLVAEFGIALNDNGSNYVSGGLAFYIR